MSPHSLLRRPQFLILGLAALSLSGCARYPVGGAGTGGTRLIFTMTMDGAVNFGTSGNPYIYLFAINLNSEAGSPTTFGPKPIVTSPYGNGLMTGDATHYIAWDPTTTSQFQIYQFTDATLQTHFPLGIPVVPHIANPGDKTLVCEVDLGQLVPDATARANLKWLQFNVMTMDKLGGTGGNRNWDALGDSRIPSQINTAFTIPLTTPGVYNNARASINEPRGDVADPSIDIVDWQVEVQFH